MHPLQIHMLKPYTPVPSHVTAFGDEACQVMVKWKRGPQNESSSSLTGVLTRREDLDMQRDTRDASAQRKDNVRTEEEGGHLL